MTAPRPEPASAPGTPAAETSPRPGADRPGLPPVAGGGPWIAVREVMNEPGPSLSASASVWTAVDALLRGGHDRVWLTDPQGKLAGQVTAAALLYAEIRGVPGERPVATLSDPVAPLGINADAATAVVRLGHGRESRIPITRAGVLVGELGRNDVLELVNGVRRIAGAANVPLPEWDAADTPAADRPAIDGSAFDSRTAADGRAAELPAADPPAAGPGAPRFLSRPSGRPVSRAARGRD